MAVVKCTVCGSEFNVVPARLKTAKFCSYKCAGIHRKTAYKGEKNHRWQGGERHKNCQFCGTDIIWAGETYATWKNRKFCSKSCADKGGLRYTGDANPNWKPDSLPKKRNAKHSKWAKEVISRDNATCQHCGVTGVELHAHHIKPFRDFPDLRFDVANGITLCHRCHWAVHGVQDEKAVNSVEPLPVKVSRKGNTEPSSQGNLLEGVTTRGRAYRRVEGACLWCGKFVSKRASNLSKSGKMFCGKPCAGKHNAATRTYRQWKNPPMAVISSTSPAPEREDIV